MFEFDSPSAGTSFDWSSGGTWGVPAAVSPQNAIDLGTAWRAADVNAGTGFYNSIGTQPVHLAAQPSVLDNIWSGLTTPFKAIGEGVVKAAPNIASGLANAAGQSLYSVMIQKMGLGAKTEKQADGTSVVYYEKPNVGVAAPLGWLFGGAQQPADINAAPRGTASIGAGSGIMLAIGVTILAFVLLSRK